MRLGIRHTALGTTGLEDAFQRASALGLDGMEIVYDYARDAAALGQADHAKELAGLAEDYGVALAGLDLNCLCATPSLIGPEADVAEARELIARALATAAEAHAGVVLVPFFGKSTLETDQEMLAAGDAMLDLVDRAAEADVVLAIESTLNSHQTLFLLDHLGSTPHVRVYFNTGVAAARRFDVASTLRDLGSERVGQVHFQDVRLRPGEPPDYNVPLGEGDVDFRAVTQSLRAIEYEGWIILEPPGAKQALDGATADLAFARSILGV